MLFLAGLPQAEEPPVGKYPFPESWRDRVQALLTGLPLVSQMRITGEEAGSAPGSGWGVALRMDSRLWLPGRGGGAPSASSPGCLGAVLKGLLLAVPREAPLSSFTTQTFA